MNSRDVKNAKYWLGLTVAALIASGCATSSYTPQSTSRTYDGSYYNGEWQLVGNASDHRVPREAWLPRVMNIRGDSQTLRISDDSGTLIAEFALDSDYPYSSTSDQDVEGRTRAHWAGPREFIVEFADHDGHRVTRSFALDRDNQQLYVRTDMEGYDRDMGGYDGDKTSFQRVYERL